MSSELKVEYTARYPVKSMAADECQLEITEKGIQGDRTYMVIEENTGNMVTQRLRSEMATMTPKLGPDNLSISSSNIESSALQVPLDMTGTRLQVVVWGNKLTGIDQGDSAAEWVSDNLRGNYRLVRKDADDIRQKEIGGQNFEFGFADSYPATVGLIESFQDLFVRIKENDPTSQMTIEDLIKRMRPNVVFAGGETYEDDVWTEIQLENGKSIWVKKITLRCPIPQINQETGIKGKEPNRTLYSYRAVLDEADKKNVAFCQKAAIDPCQIYPGLRVTKIVKGRTPPTFI